MKRALLRLSEFAFLAVLYCSVAVYCHERGARQPTVATPAPAVIAPPAVDAPLPPPPQAVQDEKRPPENVVAEEACVDPPPGEIVIRGRQVAVGQRQHPPLPQQVSEPQIRAKSLAEAKPDSGPEPVTIEPKPESPPPPQAQAAQPVQYQCNCRRCRRCWW